MRLKLLACEGMREELERAAEGSEHELDCTYLAAEALDDKTFLQRQVDLIDNLDKTQPNNRYDAILVAFGVDSYYEEGIQSLHHPLILPRAHDLIALLLGHGARYRSVYEDCDDQPYFYTRGLDGSNLLPQVNRLEKGYDHFCNLVDCKTSVEELLAARKMAADNHMAYREYVKNYEMLRALLSGNWDEQRFLTAAPGKRAVASYDSGIVDLD